jgi:hypothetical protein
VATRKPGHMSRMSCSPSLLRAMVSHAVNGSATVRSS